MNSKLKSALIGGGVFGTASALPYLDKICCAFIVGVGVLAAYLYFKGQEPMHGRMGKGASVGMLAGVFGAVAYTIVNAIVTAAGLKEAQAQEMKAMAGDVPEMAGLVDFLVSLFTEVNPITIVAMLLLSLVAHAIFSTIGGLVGAAMFAKKEEEAA